MNFKIHRGTQEIGGSCVEIWTESTRIVVDFGMPLVPGKPYYLPNRNKWEVEKRGMNYKVNPDIVTMNLGVRSLYIISQHVVLSETEAQAIVAHDGIYPVNGLMVGL